MYVFSVLPIMDNDNRRSLLVEAAGRAADYLESLDERCVGPVPGAVERLTDALNYPLPEESIKSTDIIAFLDEYGSPSTVASAGGRYFGFVTGGALPATLAANYLAGAWDQNCFSYVSSPAIACFEVAALRWIKEALGFPNSVEGAFVTGATMANFTCLAAARNYLLAGCGWDVDQWGLFGAPNLTVVVGEEAHATLFKTLSMLGLGRGRVTIIPSDSQGRMRPEKLPIITGPTIVCVQAGNVNSGAFDPFEPIIDWAHKGNAWVHVDGAFGIWALVSSEHEHLAQAVLNADSWATDAHKWLNVPYDSGIALVRDPDALTKAMSISGSYLPESNRRDAMHYTPDSSRRARAIEIWVALRSLGRIGLESLVKRNCRQARKFADELGRSGIEILNEVSLNQVVVNFGDEDKTNRVIAAIQETGVCWCGGTIWRGKKAMRLSLSSWITTDDDIERSVSMILDVYGKT